VESRARRPDRRAAIVNTLRHVMAGSLRLMWRFRLRSGLVLLAAALGVAGVVTSVDYASGGRRQVLTEIGRMGTNVIVVTPQQSRAVAGRARTGSLVTTLIDRDYRNIREAVPALVQSSAWVSRSFTMKAGALSKNTAVIGCEPAYFLIKNWPAADGRLFDEADVRRSARVAVLGRTVARDLFGDASPIGTRLLINRVPFAIVGVLAERGQGLDVANEDDQVYVPLPTAMHRLMNVDYFDGILLEIGELRDMDASARAVDAALRRYHPATPSLPADFQVQNQKTLIDTQLAASGRLTFLVRSAGFSGLAVSGLGILAICWIGVRERTVEIGTRRALGATAGIIFFQILFEAIVLALAGCALGLALGWYASAAIAARAGLPFVFDAPTAALALASAIGMNLIFAVLPARSAARLDPIRALKYE
jgi:putative ABC transport system permease protein